ncbi:MAG: IS6 family transposase [Chloroflexota bacterium]
MERWLDYEIVVFMSNSHHHPIYTRHRYPQEIIAYAVWLYHRLCLSYCDVLAERGIIVSYESIRKWCLKFGHAYVRRIRKQRKRIGDKWHVDEVFVKIRGKRYYLYQAIDQFGNVLDIFMHPRRNKNAALCFFEKLRSTYQQVPRVLITDKLRSYQASLKMILKGYDLNTLPIQDQLPDDLMPELPPQSVQAAIKRAYETQ